MADDNGSAAKIQKLSVPEDENDGNDLSVSDFDKDTQKALEEIDACQTEIDGLNEKASEEILQVEQKYNKLRKPHFEDRNKLIQKISNFWMTAFVNHPQISVILSKDDEECLQYLEKVEVDEFEDIKSGYNIHFTFTSNPYFTNTKLTKEFQLGSLDSPVSKSTPIEWKNGMNLVKKNESIKNIKNNRKRSYGLFNGFFAWFCDNSDPSIDEIAEVIKDDMWPNPLQYYLTPDIEVGENGISDEDDDDDTDDDDDVHDESVVVVDDDDEDDVEPYDVDDDDDDDDDEDDDDDDLNATDNVEVIDDDEDEEDVEGKDGEEKESKEPPPVAVEVEGKAGEPTDAK